MSVANEVAELTVDLGNRSYDIQIGRGLIDVLGASVAELRPARRTAIVTDSNVGPIYLDRVAQSLAKQGLNVSQITLPAGEETKRFSVLEDLLSQLLTMEIERGDFVLALGGGVVGDIAGFAASILKRGVDLVQVPTSLLAQVDSSVGGKTGIDTPHGKNLVGSFHQPKLVVIDTAVLATLPRRELLAGYAEVVKYGLIRNFDFFEWLETHGSDVIGLKAEAVQHAVKTSCRAKSEIVSADEKESGERALLNLGHTFAHALEVCAGYGSALLHGEAVSVGMALAFELAAECDLVQRQEAQRVSAHLRSVGLMTAIKDIKSAFNTAELVDAMRHDKKIVDGAPRLILPRAIGDAFVSSDVTFERIQDFLDARLKD
jgi:3-dehydroquinate synthase